jgi:hypothetical protein
MWFSVSAYRPHEGHFVAVFDVITERKRAEEDRRQNQARLEGLLRIAQHDAPTEQDLLDNALHEAIALTGSAIGYVGRYDQGTGRFAVDTWFEDQHLRDPSRVTEMGYPYDDELEAARRRRRDNGTNPSTNCTTCHR